MNDLIEAFLLDLVLARGRSTHTLAAYRRNLAQFLDYAAGHDVSEARVALAPLALQRYAAHLHRQGLRATSIRQKIATLRSFVSYLRECHPTEAPVPGQARIRYRAQRRPRLTLSFEQLRALLDHLRQRAQISAAAPDERRHLLALRDHALFALLAGTGMRIGEALAIELDDLDLERGQIQIHGKGGHERIVFCDLPELRDPLRRYVDARAQAAAVRTPRLFVNGRDLGPLSSRAAQLRLRDLASEIDLPSGVTPHVLRHTYATLAIERGANIKAVSQLLGHADVRVTLQLYTQLSNDHLAEVFRLCHPLRDNELDLPEIINNRKKMIPYLR
ncbi:MAG: tyrosine-type recombinase/integrase [Myxococcota bacterium]